MCHHLLKTSFLEIFRFYLLWYRFVLFLHEQKKNVKDLTQLHTHFVWIYFCKLFSYFTILSLNPILFNFKLFNFFQKQVVVVVCFYLLNFYKHPCSLLFKEEKLLVHMFVVLCCDVIAVAVSRARCGLLMSAAKPLYVLFHSSVNRWQTAFVFLHYLGRVMLPYVFFGSWAWSQVKKKRPNQNAEKRRKTKSVTQLQKHSHPCSSALLEGRPNVIAQRT